jgi:hypothetical protein
MRFIHLTSAGPPPRSLVRPRLSPFLLPYLCLLLHLTPLFLCRLLRCPRSPMVRASDFSLGGSLCGCYVFGMDVFMDRSLRVPRYSRYFIAIPAFSSSILSRSRHSTFVALSALSLPSFCLLPIVVTPISLVLLFRRLAHCFPALVPCSTLPALYFSSHRFILVLIAVSKVASSISSSSRRCFFVFVVFFQCRIRCRCSVHLFRLIRCALYSVFFTCLFDLLRYFRFPVSGFFVPFCRSVVVGFAFSRLLSSSPSSSSSSSPLSPSFCVVFAVSAFPASFISVRLVVFAALLFSSRSPRLVLGCVIAVGFPYRAHLHLGGFVCSLLALGWCMEFLVFFISVGMCSLHCVGLRRLMFFFRWCLTFLFNFSGDVWGQAPIQRCFLHLVVAGLIPFAWDLRLAFSVFTWGDCFHCFVVSLSLGDFEFVF